MNLRDSIAPADWDDIVHNGTRRHFHPGAPLMRQGESPAFAIALTEGTVKITEDTVDGRQVPLALRGAGELLGETGVLLGQPRTASVWAVTWCTGHTLSAAVFRSLVERRKLSEAVYRLSVRRSLEKESHLSNLLCHTPDVRMARFLTQIGEEIGEEQPRGVILHLGMDREELGFVLRMSRSTAFDALRRLKQLGLIESEQKSIRILDQRGLEEYAPQEMRDVS